MKLRNKYYVLRHGEALSNTRNIVSSWPEKFKNPLTQYGKQMIMTAAEILEERQSKPAKAIDMIFASDLLRTRQTAQIVGKTLKLTPKFDKRLREIGFGNMNAGPIIALDKAFKKESERITRAMPRGETYKQVLRRAYRFLKETDKKYKGKSILIISHESPLWMLEAKLKGWSLEEGLKKISRKERIHKGEIKELTSV